METDATQTTQAQTQQTQEAAPAAEKEPEKFGLFTEDSDDAPPPEAKPEPKIDPAIHELSRRERILKDRERDIKRLRKEAEEYSSVRELAAKDPLAAMQKIGLDFDAAFQHYLGGDKKPEPDPQSEELRILREKVAAIEAHGKAEQRTQAERQLAYVLRGAVDENRHKALHAMIDEPEVVQQIMEGIQLRYKNEGVAPDMEEVLETANTYLEQSFKERLPAVLKAAQRLGLLQNDAPQKSKTAILSNDMGGDTAAMRQRPMTEDERREEFVKIMSKDGWQKEDE
jgi:hypothetical protein